MKEIQGDLLELASSGHFDVIIHGANCQCKMGSGIAKQIRTRWPEVYEADLETEVGDRGKLGSITCAEIEGADITVINAYTQFDYRGPQPRVDYNAIRSAFREIKSRFSGKKIGYPKIGAGLGGGDWNIISEIINEELEGEDHTLVIWKP